MIKRFKRLLKLTIISTLFVFWWPLGIVAISLMFLRKKVKKTKPSKNQWDYEINKNNSMNVIQEIDLNSKITEIPGISNDEQKIVKNIFDEENEKK